MRRTDLLLHVGGECVKQYGTLVRKTTRGEDNGYTHTRASTGSFVGSTRLEWATSGGIPRVEVLSGEHRLLLERAATNLLRDPNDLPDWLQASTQGQIIAGPDGSTDGRAYRLRASTAGGTARTLQAWGAAGTRASTSGAGPITGSFCIKRNSTGSTPLVGFSNTAGGAINNGSVAVTWTSTGGIASLSASTDSAIRGSSVGINIGNGWHWVAFAGTSTIRNTTAWDYQIRASTNAAHFVDIANLQVEATAYATSWVGGTTAAAITRSADTFYVDFPYPPQAMTVYVKFIERGTVAAAPSGLFQVGGSADSGARFRVVVATATSVYRIDYTDGTDTAAVAAAATPSVGDTVEIRAVLNADGSVTLGQTINAGTEAVTNSAGSVALPTAWAGTRFYLNSRSGANNGASQIISTKVARGVNTLAEMRAL